MTQTSGLTAYGGVLHRHFIPFVLLVLRPRIDESHANQRRNHTEIRYANAHLVWIVLRYGQNSPGGIPFISMYSLLTMLEILHYEEAQKEKRQSDA